jgi:DNA (cytosine-5)-methyltransferase 1
MITGVDLFAGLGGWSTGAKKAGVKILWAANHWPVAVEWHHANHPEVVHSCQDLNLADWSLVPKHDLFLASPCCQGHSRARGKKNGDPQHDASRATAWAIPAALEFHNTPMGILENVPELLQWVLYPAWASAMNALGYQLAPHIVDCAELGVPQNRLRLFIVCTKSKAPLFLNLPHLDHVPASSFINFNSGRWSSIEKPGRAIATLERVKNGRWQFGDRFLMPYYGSGSGLTGRSLERPIGTITTRDRWAIVDGDRMRMLSADENMRAMTFPAETKHPDNHKLTVHMAGNAVPPLAAQRIIEALLESA